jgi:hypothetical protein
MCILSPNHKTMKRFFFYFLAILTFVSCTNYGKKVKVGNIEMYYKEGVTTAEANKAASVLDKIDKAENNNVDTRRSFQLLREGDTVTLRMVVNIEKAKDMPDANFIGIATVVSDSIFGGKPVNMDLTNETFKTVRHIPFQKQAEETNTDDVNIAAFGPKVTVDNVEVYRKGSTEEEAKTLAAFANNYFKPTTTFSYQLEKNEAGNFTVKMVANLSAVDKFDQTFFTTLGKGICDAMQVASVRIEMTDEKFTNVKAFNYSADAGLN